MQTASRRQITFILVWFLLISDQGGGHRCDFRRARLPVFRPVCLHVGGGFPHRLFV